MKVKTFKTWQKFHIYNWSGNFKLIKFEKILILLLILKPINDQRLNELI